MTCQPLGIPRHGPPRRIVQSDKDVIFFYTQYADGGGGAGEYRIIPTDGRKQRQGNQIKFEVTVEDPEVLVEPWVMTPKILRLNANPDAGLLPERGNCEVYELSDITSQIRH